MDTGLKGRTAVVPGASSGLGLAVARSLAAEGANVVLGGRRGELVRDEAAKLPSAVGVEVDLTDPAATDALIGAAQDHFGPVDVLVLNGGGPPPGTAVDFTPEQLADAVALLVQPHQRLVRAVLPGMRERGFGRIVFMSSVAAFTGGIVGPHYAASKAGLHGLTHWLASRFADSAVTVNAIAPALIEETGMLPGGSEDLAQRVPVGRLGKPDEVADLTLAVIRNGYITNQVMEIDGGMYPR
jgi:3-oxoacyl-[acyl-carrier protein] reductase